jgi:hypothetical protein
MKKRRPHFWETDSGWAGIVMFIVMLWLVFYVIPGGKA